MSACTVVPCSTGLHRLAGPVGQTMPCRARCRDCRSSAISRRRRWNWRRPGSTGPAARRSSPRGRPTGAPSSAASGCAPRRWCARTRTGRAASVPASGVPSTWTRRLIGTESGCAGRLARVCSRPARCSRDSPMPTMPPQQVFMPASRTCDRVSRRSWYLAGVDDLVVELRRGVEVVVVVVQAGLAQRLRPGRPRACPGSRRSPGPAPSLREIIAATFGMSRSLGERQAAPMQKRRGAGGLGLAGLLQHRLGAHQLGRLDAGVVARRLRAVAAVLGAAAGLDRQQRADLDLGRVEVLRGGPGRRGAAAPGTAGRTGRALRRATSRGEARPGPGWEGWLTAGMGFSDGCGGTGRAVWKPWPALSTKQGAFQLTARVEPLPAWCAGSARRYGRRVACCAASPAHDGLDLCRACHAALPYNRQACAPLRPALAGSRPGLRRTACADRPRSRPPGLPSSMRSPLDRLLPRLKFHGDLASAAAAGRPDGAHPGRGRPTAGLVPVPLHRARLREPRLRPGAGTGAAARTRPAGAVARRPAAATARHRRAVAAGCRWPPPQPARRLRRAYASAHCRTHVALVDDVMTTGATVHAAVAALRRAGVARVDVWVCARVP